MLQAVLTPGVEEKLNYAEVDSIRFEFNPTGLLPMTVDQLQVIICEEVGKWPIKHSSRVGIA